MLTYISTKANAGGMFSYVFVLLQNKQFFFCQIFTDEEIIMNLNPLKTLYVGIKNDTDAPNKFSVTQSQN